MPSLAEMLSRLTVKVTSPDNQIMMVLRRGSDITVRFRSGAFEDYEQYELESQLSSMLTTGWEAHRTGSRQAIAEAGGEPFDDDHVHWDANRRRYRAATLELKVLGKSDRKRIRVRTVGMRSFAVQVKPGALPTFTEDEFRHELVSAIQNMLAQHQFELVDLKVAHLGLKVPGSALSHAR